MEFHAFLAKSAVIFFAIIGGMFGGVTLPEPSTTGLAQGTSTPATTTLSTLPGGSGFFTPSWPKLNGFASTTLPLPFSIPQQPKSTPVPDRSVVPPVVTPVTPKPVETPAPSTNEPNQPSLGTNAGIAEVEDAIVHILCTSKKTGLRSISGSGSIIDSRGLILTAAHVGQYLLIEKESNGADMSCVIRMGDPARALYKATPVYISESWVTDNATAIVQAQATGNGKNDYGILAITGSATGGSLPSSFPTLSLGSVTPSKGDAIIIGTYGAEFLTSEQIRSSLSPTLVETSIKKIYSLGTTAVDLLSLGASDAAQSGSSGGVVVSKGKVIGVVTTSSLGADRSTRDLRAISLGHIRKSFENETGGSFDLDMQASIGTLIQKFAGTESALAELLQKSIDDAN